MKKYIFYENTFVNKLIVSFVAELKECAEDYSFVFDNIEQIDKQFVQSKYDDGYRLIILFSNRYPLRMVESILPDNVNEDNQINVIMKDEPQSFADDYFITNWFLYWSKLIHESVESTLLHELLSNSVTIPQRRIREYCESIKSLPPHKFVIEVSNLTSESCHHRGMKLINSRQTFINDITKHCRYVTINNDMYGIIVGNHNEAAYQILDKKLCIGVLMCDLQINKNNVLITLITDPNLESPIKDMLSFTKGIYKFNSNFDFFINIVKEDNLSWDSIYDPPIYEKKSPKTVLSELIAEPELIELIQDSTKSTQELIDLIQDSPGEKSLIFPEKIEVFSPQPAEESSQELLKTPQETKLTDEKILKKKVVGRKKFVKLT
uniref:Uncharacterized protein n=1 Tax=viral metagenome TaxID=1070528 RepID=A0A6C0JE45_9ZZZZ